ncbi:MAG: MFS transporter [bacterium]
MNQPASNTLAMTLASSWALLLGFGILMLGDGLQGTLLAVRAHREGFPTAITGLVMSSFYAGFLAGTLWTPWLVKRVGHIRVFAALAALASASILVHAAYVHPAAWFALRLLSGICFSGLYIVAESWLNDSVANRMRGQLLSIYMVITYVAVGGGQLFLNLADPSGYALFVLTSVLISIAVVPLLLTATPTPRFEQSDSVGLIELYRISPLGVFGVFAVGFSGAAIFALGPVYAGERGMDTAGISYFMLAPVLATVLLQWPIGKLSDRFDRRAVIVAVTALAAAAAALCAYAARLSDWHAIVLFGLFGGFSLPMYALFVAHTNDHLRPDQMVAASGALTLANGIGAILGPLGIALAMDISPHWFFAALAIAHGVIGAFALLRMTLRSSKPLAEQGAHAPATLSRSRRMTESIQAHLRDDSTGAAPDGESAREV